MAAFDIPVSRVEAFVTGIKIESSDQSSFGELIKGSKDQNDLQTTKINNQEHAAAI